MSLLNDIKTENPVEEKILEVIYFYENNDYLRLIQFESIQNKETFDVINSLYNFKWEDYQGYDSDNKINNYNTEFNKYLLHESIKLENAYRDYMMCKHITEIELSQPFNNNSLKHKNLKKSELIYLNAAYKMKIIRRILLPHQLKKLDEYDEIVKNMNTLKLKMETNNITGSILDPDYYPWIEPIVNICSLCDTYYRTEIKSFLNKIRELYLQ